MTWAKPDLAPENLDADGIVDFAREVATNESLPLSVDEIVNENLPQHIETVKDSSSDEDEVLHDIISRPSQNNTVQPTLFTIGLDLHPLLLKSQTKSVKKRLDRMK